MIRIHTGVSKGQSIPKSALILSTPEEYPAIRLKLRDAIHARENTDVYITHRACDGWFWDLADYPVVSLINDDPREQLRRKLGVLSLPRELEETPELIFALELLDLKAPSQSGMFMLVAAKLDNQQVINVWSWILKEKLGAVWTEVKPSFEHLSALVRWYLNAALQQQNDADAVPAPLQQKVRSIIDEWIRRSEGNLKSAYDAFFENPIPNAFFLACWQNFSDKYPELLKEWFREAESRKAGLSQEDFYCPKLEWVAEKLAPVELKENLITGFSKKIEIYWNGKLHQQPISLTWEEALSAMSGKVMGEFRALKRCLEENLSDCTRLALEKIRLAFKDLAEAQEELDKLEQKLPPPQPTLPDETWETDEWIRWGVEQYIPFKKWLIDNNQYSEIAFKTSRLYEEWLYSNYPSFIHHPECLVYGVFKQVDKLLSEGKRVLWLFVDNLPVYWLPYALKAFTNHRMVLACEPQYTFAMLPSVTSISRKAALAGQLPSQIDVSTYDITAFIESWHKKGVHEVKIVEQVDKLPETVQSPAQIYLLIYNQLDYIAHTPEHRLTNRQFEIETKLNYLAGKVEEAMEILGQLGDACVFVSTDHGSTSLSEKAVKLAVPPSAKLDENFEQHRRFIRIADASALNQHDWFVLSADLFGLPETYAVAKGERFIERKPGGYTHGGLTPEETIIPMIIFQPGSVATELLLSFAHISEPVRRGRIQSFRLAVDNPFSLAITSLEIFLPKFGIHTKLARIPPTTRGETEELEIRLQEKYPAVLLLKVSASKPISSRRCSTPCAIKEATANTFKHIFYSRAQTT